LHDRMWICYDLITYLVKMSSISAEFVPGIRIESHLIFL
jgi:hypothetical protein